MAYRLYTFVNYYLSSIQQGIQTAHVLGEIVRVHGADNAAVDEWLCNDKTIIVLNGGNCASVERIYSNAIVNSNYPGAFFREDDESLGGIVTACGVILPESVWNARRGSVTDGMGGYYYEYGQREDNNYVMYSNGTYSNDTMFNLIEAIRDCDLAK